MYTTFDLATGATLAAGNSGSDWSETAKRSRKRQRERAFANPFGTGKEVGMTNTDPKRRLARASLRRVGDPRLAIPSVAPVTEARLRVSQRQFAA